MYVNLFNYFDYFNDLVIMLFIKIVNIIIDFIIIYYIILFR